MHRRVGIGIGLKVNNKFIGFIKVLSALHSLLQLLADGRQFTGKLGCKRIYVAIGTTAVALTAITVGTGKTTIYNYFKDTLSFVLFFKVRTVIIISLYA
ncbi:hypothetical protein D3C86_1411700 [compost metagenome]